MEAAGSFVPFPADGGDIQTESCSLAINALSSESIVNEPLRWFPDYSCTRLTSFAADLQARHELYSSPVVLIGDTEPIIGASPESLSALGSKTMVVSDLCDEVFPIREAIAH